MKIKINRLIKTQIKSTAVFISYQSSLVGTFRAEKKTNCIFVHIDTCFFSILNMTLENPTQTGLAVITCKKMNLWS